MRIAIMGNSGSGKSWLAKRLSGLMQAPVIHLDAVVYESGGYERMRSEADILERVQAAMADDAWVLEGIYGNILASFLALADELVWLDMPMALCEARFGNRQAEAEKDHDRSVLDLPSRPPYDFVRRYVTEQDSWSRHGHRQLFDAFIGVRHQLTSEQDVLQYLETGFGYQDGMAREV